MQAIIDTDDFDTDDFDPSVVYHGALVEVEYEHVHEPARVVRTELHQGVWRSASAS